MKKLHKDLEENLEYMARSFCKPELFTVVGGLVMSGIPYPKHVNTNSNDERSFQKWKEDRHTETWY